VFILFGALVATAGVQTSRSAGVEADSHENLVGQVNAGDAVLEAIRDDLTTLRAEVISARFDNRTARTAEARADADVTRMGTELGTIALSGPGLRIVANDAVDANEDAEYVLDKDLRNIVTGLWEAGAEAISINGERISSLTAIRFAGCCITVNYEKLAPPYVVFAIGDPDTLPARFVESTAGTYWLNAQETFGLRFEMDVDDSLTIPAVSPDRLQLRNATSKPVEAQ
ncbi:MAG TPA: DUF881 domain-containing protein, partial [Nocardioidaceae bacterium]|nr:DUF881 domain-containing protein [Nocardioidaceae bacterium]